MLTASPNQKHLRFRDLLPIWLSFLALTAIFHEIYSPFFDPGGASGNGVGHDYSLALPALLDGRYWFINNGIFSAPWFSPAFCAGQPFFADPQSIFYSPIQFLSFFIEPLAASYVSLLLTACAGYWGMYLFCKRSMQLETAPSILAASIWMFNGFSTHHHLVGHIGFLDFLLAPLVTWLLVSKEPLSWQAKASRIGFSGLLVAGALHAGLGSLMVPFGFCVWGLACLAIIRGAPWRQFYILASTTAVLALGIATSKIVAASALMKNFPRAQYPLPGISSFTDHLEFVTTLLFRPEEENFVAKASMLINRAIGIGPHELAFDLTLVPLIVTLGACLIILVTNRQAVPIKIAPEKVSHLVLFSILTIIPLALLYYSPEWNATLKQLPVIKSTSAPWRWLVELSPFICVLCANALSRALGHRPAFRILITVLAITSLVTLKATVPREFYETQSYNPTPILEAFQKSQAPEFTPRISAIGAYLDDAGNIAYTSHQNDLIAIGASQAFCYNPLFGYNIENFEIRTLRPGNPLSARDGVLNLKNPACYVFPKENDCQPGDHFKDTIEERKAAERFINYRQLSFKFSKTQELANLVSTISLIIALSLIAAAVVIKIPVWSNRKPSN